MGTFQVDHAAHSRHDARKELGAVFHELRFEEISRADPKVEFSRKELDEARHDVEMGVELYLTRAVDDQVIVVKVAQRIM